MHERSAPAFPGSAFKPGVGGLVLVVATILAPGHAHGFWGLLGKAASGAGKAAAGGAGKSAATGVVAAETLAEAGAVRRAAGAAGAGGTDDFARGSLAGAAEHSVVNAALPPEVAAYLAKPARDVTSKEAAKLMTSYEELVARAGRTGDYAAFVEGKTALHARTKEIPPSGPVPFATKPAPGLSAEGFRLIVHASNAGHKAAQSEIDALCTPGSPAANRFNVQIRFSKAYQEMCAARGKSSIGR
ncbi:hypothetical protein ACSFA0_25240 [Variovorax sp. LT1P1]|uniref:hypothetical protein n=1 Tax=Variovorax sp. LT1P1 TaxID=3443730 RepID=UPI003F489CE5